MKNQRLSSDQTYQWTALVLKAIRHTLDKMLFHEILPATLSQDMEAGAFHAVVVLGNKGRPKIMQSQEDNVMVSGKEAYYLAVSQTYEKQQAVEYLDKVYCLAPCTRLLKAGEETSGKHLSTFFQLEIEWATESMEEVITKAEEILIEMVHFILAKMESFQLELSGIAKRNLQSIQQGQFSKITFDEAIALANATEGQPRDFTVEENTILSEKFDRPFWIYRYPEGVRDSIFHKNEDNTYSTFDLMLPFGYGELITGGVREKNTESILQQAARLDTSTQINSKWYAHWKNNRKIQTAGFGLGLERWMKFVSGSQTILDFIQPHDFGPNEKMKSKNCE